MRLQFTIALLLAALTTLSAQDPWQAGARYRAYSWVTPDTGEVFLRVGGRYGYAATPGKFPAHLQDGADLILPHDVVLEGARAATVTLEKVLSHEDTRDLTIAFNGHAPIAVPEPAAVPAPQPDYMYHTDVRVDVPLDYLRPGRANRFRLAVDTAQRWGWPQNVFYAVTLHVYYEPAAAGTSATALDYPHAEAVPLESTVRLRGVQPADAAAEYAFEGLDVDWGGTGANRRVHYQTFRAAPHHTLGRSEERASRFAVRWHTAWLPDQPGAMRLHARVRDTTGLWRVLAPLPLKRLAPRPYGVHVVRAEPAPANWVTRADTFAQRYHLDVAPERVDAYRLHWTSWSPCYANGVYLNDHLLWMRNEACYVYDAHTLTFDDDHSLHFLEAGANVVHTGKTPLVRGQMVHGMEVQWPGIQLLVRVRE